MTTPFSYRERLLVLSDDDQESSNSSGTGGNGSNLLEFRVESLGEWKTDALIHPFNGDWLRPNWDDSDTKPNNHGLIAQVRMSVASHATQSMSNDPFFFVTNNRTPLSMSKSSMSSSYSSPGMDGVPLMMASTSTSPRPHYPIFPQGFSLVVETVPMIWIEDYPNKDCDSRNDFGGDDLSKVNDKNRARANRAVQDIVFAMMRQRLLTTPISDGKWDIQEIDLNEADDVHHDDNYNHTGQHQDQRHPPHQGQHQHQRQRRRKFVYKMVLPFTGAAWSSDALEQAWRNGGTLPLPLFCGTTNATSDNQQAPLPPQFFGLSSLEWSDFLVTGNHEIGIGNEKTSATSRRLQPLRKKMWWTWSLKSSDHDNDGTGTDFDGTGTEVGTGTDISLAYGIQVQAAMVSSLTSPVSSLSIPSLKGWIPPTFLSESSSCPPLGRRELYQVRQRRQRRRPHGIELANDIDDDHVTDSFSVSTFDLVPLLLDGEEPGDENNNSVDDEGSSLSSVSGATASMNVHIEQVLRRHHTNRGRFESWIEIHQSESSMSNVDGNDDTFQHYCQLTYRQVFPEFITPVWRSLKIVDGYENDGRKNDNNSRISPMVRATVEWKPDDGSSVLHVTAIAGDNYLHQQKKLPSNLLISLEYAPTFLTLDDFPGDPNRGRELPPAHLTIQCRQGRKGATGNDLLLSVYSNSLLHLPPVPDMSMPFNVISLTSSLYAYVIGTLITILVRKASEKIKYKLHPEKRPPSKMKQLKEKFQTKVLSRFRQRDKNNYKERDGKMDDEDTIGMEKNSADDAGADPRTA